LQQGTKWRSPGRRLKVNDVVLIKDETLPPMCWPLARVSALIPGRDGVCRVADLKTSTGDIRRAVNKLSLLHINDGPSGKEFWNKNLISLIAPFDQRSQRVVLARVKIGVSSTI